MLHHPFTPPHATRSTLGRIDFARFSETTFNVFDDGRQSHAPQAS